MVRVSLLVIGDSLYGCCDARSPHVLDSRWTAARLRHPRDGNLGYIRRMAIPPTPEPPQADLRGALGSPTLWWNNSARNNWLLFRFMVSSRPSQLGDPAIARAVRVMRVYWVCDILYWVCVLVAMTQLRTR